MWLNVLSAGFSRTFWNTEVCYFFRQFDQSLLLQRTRSWNIFYYIRNLYICTCAYTNLKLETFQYYNQQKVCIWWALYMEIWHLTFESRYKTWSSSSISASSLLMLVISSSCVLSCKKNYVVRNNSIWIFDTMSVYKKKRWRSIKFPYALEIYLTFIKNISIDNWTQTTLCFIKLSERMHIKQTVHHQTHRQRTAKDSG